MTVTDDRVQRAIEALEFLAAADIATMDRGGLSDVTAARRLVVGFCDQIDLARRATFPTVGVRRPFRVTRRRAPREGRRSNRDAKAAAGRAETAAQMPTLGDALGDGAITAGHLDAIANATAELTDEQKAELRHPRRRPAQTRRPGVGRDVRTRMPRPRPRRSSPNQSTTTAQTSWSGSGNEHHPLVDRPRDRHGPHPHRARPRIARQDPRLVARQAPLAQAPTGPTRQRRPARPADPRTTRSRRIHRADHRLRCPRPAGPRSHRPPRLRHIGRRLARQLAVRNHRRHPDPARDRPALLLHRQHHPRRPRIRRTTTRRRRRLTTRHPRPTPRGVHDVPHLRRPRLLHPRRQLAMQIHTTSTNGSFTN